MSWKQWTKNAKLNLFPFTLNIFTLPATINEPCWPYADWSLEINIQTHLVYCITILEYYKDLISYWIYLRQIQSSEQRRRKTYWNIGCNLKTPTAPANVCCWCVCVCVSAYAVPCLISAYLCLWVSQRAVRVWTFLFSPQTCLILSHLSFVFLYSETVSEMTVYIYEESNVPC